MRYAIIDIDKAKGAGFQEILHNCYGSKMVVNENELRHLDKDIDEVARKLGGYTLSNSELTEYIRKQQ